MVQSIGLQQVLQLSSAVERAQMAQQSQTSELARGFDKEFEKIADHKREQTQAMSETENAKIRDEDQRKRKHYARHLPQPSQDRKEKDEPENKAVQGDSDQGAMINVVA